MGILLFELFRNPLFMGILNKWETLVCYIEEARSARKHVFSARPAIQPLRGWSWISRVHVLPQTAVAALP